jgi:protein-arginine deiminase
MPAIVNLLVVTGTTFAGHRLVLPDPFGPQIGGRDPFEDDVRSKLTALGYGAGQIRFVDVYDTYHRLLGEVHCGTNSKRTPDPTPWWEQTDF